MKPIDVKSNTYIDSIKESKIHVIFRISKYKNAFAKCHIPNSSEVSNSAHMLNWKDTVIRLIAEQI